MSDHNHGDHSHAHGDHGHAHGGDAHGDHAHGGHGHDAGHETKFKAYLAVFVALCVFTAASFAINLTLGHNTTSAGLILLVAVVKAALVAYVFMHLNFDWRTVYGIMVPVLILAVMTVVILSIDGAIVWGRDAPNARGLPETEAVAPGSGSAPH